MFVIRDMSHGPMQYAISTHKSEPLSDVEIITKTRNPVRCDLPNEIAEAMVGPGLAVGQCIEVSPQPMAQVVVVTDDGSTEQAIYVDGVLKYASFSIYASQIAKECEGKAIRFESRCVERLTPDWPEQLDRIVEVV